MNSEFAPLFELGRAERIQLVEDLWDSIAQEEVETTVSNVKTDELRKRKENFLRGPSAGRTWEQVKELSRRENG